MTVLSDDARRVLEQPRLAHLVSLNADGSPQVTVVWVGLDGDEIVSAHLAEHQKVRNIRNDPRVALSVFDQILTLDTVREYIVFGPFTRPNQLMVFDAATDSVTTQTIGSQDDPGWSARAGKGGS